MSREPTKAVPLTCHGHSRPITHLSFSSAQQQPQQQRPQSPSTNGLSSSLSAPQYYLISACKDNNPMLRDGLTGDWIGTFIGHKGAVWCTRLSPDASLAATGSADFSAKVWDTFTGELLVDLAHEHIVRAVAFGPTSASLASNGTGDEGVSGAGTAGIKPEKLATGGMEKKLRVWDIRHLGASSNGSASSRVNGNSSTTKLDPSQATETGAGAHTASIKSIVWAAHSPNVLTTAADDRKIRWWDLRSSSAAPVASHDVSGLIGSCELSQGPDGRAEGTLSVAAGKDVYFFDAHRPGTLVKSVTLQRDVSSVAVYGGGSGQQLERKFVTGGSGDTWVHVWDYESEVEIETGKGHHGPVWTTAFSPDGKLYATGSEDGTIKLWKATSEPYGLWR